MGNRIAVRYGVLVLVPALVIAGLAFFLLGHEKERMETVSIRLAEDQAKTLAGTIRIKMDAIKNALMQDMVSIPEAGRASVLVDWAEKHPLVRNVFLTRGESILYPAARAQDGATNEELQFRQRYAALFSGQVPWENPALEDGVDVNTSSRKAEGSYSVFLPESLNQMDLSLKQSFPGRYKQGWRPWFSDNQMFLLGWVQDRSAGITYGAELEMMAVLSRVISLFPDTVPTGTCLTLEDGSGTRFHQSGGCTIKPKVMPDLRVMLPAALPHWSVAVYLDSTAAVHYDFLFWIISGLLVCLFLVSILAGGGMLAWQAHRNMRDALQKTSFVAQVSHELKTPLTSIRMYAELLHDGRITDAKKQHQAVAVIVKESARLGRLISNVLDFSRLEQGEKKYYSAQLDLAPELLDQLERMTPQLRSAGMDVIRQIPDRGICIFTDRDALNQVVVNLLDNAIKYASEGKEIMVSAGCSDGECHILVCDRGPGVPEKDRHQIFKRFARLDTDLTSEKPGTGLGLSISRQIIRDLGGDLTCEPREGGGACFRIDLPESEDKTI